MWSTLENTPPPITTRIKYVLACCELRYFSFMCVTRFKRPRPYLLTGIALIALMMGERDFGFPKKLRDKKVSKSSSTLQQTRLPYFVWIKSSNLFFDLIDLILRAFIVRYQYYTIKFRYKNVTQSALFFAYKNVTQSVRLFIYINVTQIVYISNINVTQRV